MLPSCVHAVGDSACLLAVAQAVLHELMEKVAACRALVGPAADSLVHLM